MDLPAELLFRQNWILWRYVGADNRKVPFQTNGQPAKSNDRSTWTTFTAADAAKNGYAGLGFVFAEGEGIFGIDLDACILADGTISAWADKILKQFPTYAEISPSGSGIKIFGKGVIPGGTGRKREMDGPEIAGRRPAVEVYGQGRYFTVTRTRLGDYRELANCQAALNALYARLWAAITAPAPVPPIPQTDISERARRYLALVPPAVSGSGGHNHTFRVACVLVLGFRLSPEQAYPLLADWNQTCQPAWSEKELRHKLADADKQAGERGWLLDGRGYSGPDVDLATLLASLSLSEHPTDAPPPTEVTRPRLASEIPFPRECIDGMPPLMRLAYDWILDTAIKPQPELTLGALIAMFGAVFGRKVRDDYGTRSNVMVLGLSPSGSGKEHPRQCIKRLLFLSGLDLLNGPERVGSHAGIISSVSAHPVRLFQLDEIGRLLQTMRDPRAAPHLYNIGTVLMQLYSSANSIWTGDAYADLNKVKRVNQPHVCIFGTSVPENFFSGLTPENLSDGLLARLIVLESSGYSERRKPAIAEPPELLVAALRDWASLDTGGNLSKENPEPILVGKTTEADARHEQYCDEVHGRHSAEDSTHASIWARAPEKEAKLALIYACCSCSGGVQPINLEGVNWARRIVNYSTRLVLSRARESVSESRWEGEKKKVWRKLVSGMTVNELCRKTQWLHDRERSEVLSELARCGAIEFQETPTATKPKTIIHKLRNNY